MTKTTLLARLALVTSLYAASPAFAADWSTNTARILGDPSFLPLSGQMEGVFSYTYSANLYDTTTGNAFDGRTSNDRSTNNFLPTLRFGTTDDISVFADLGFGNARTVQDRTYESYIFQPVFTLVHARRGRPTTRSVPMTRISAPRGASSTSARRPSAST